MELKPLDESASSTESKILFVSQESSWDVVQGALSSGGQGYIVKAHAASELLVAVEEVCQGRQYIGSGISDLNRADVSREQDSQRLPRREPPTPGKGPGSHAVQFYADNESLLVGFTRFIEAALKVGNAVVVLATPSHQNNLVQRLQAEGLNIGAAIEQGTYIPLDVAETLSTFLVDDVPDPVRFRKVASDLLATAAKAAKGENPRVAACGECAPTLWAQGNANAAVQVERLWDEITKTTNIDVLCGYVLSSFQREQEGDVYERICAEHSVVYSP
ncbi:MAG: MEDS domain-containing protein [Terriglobales bacterium]